MLFSTMLFLHKKTFGNVNTSIFSLQNSFYQLLGKSCLKAKRKINITNFQADECGCEK